MWKLKKFIVEKDIRPKWRALFINNWIQSYAITTYTSPILFNDGRQSTDDTHDSYDPIKWRKFYTSRSHNRIASDGRLGCQILENMIYDMEQSKILYPVRVKRPNIIRDPEELFE